MPAVNIILDEQGREVGDYKGSYALLIGVSRYDHWDDLPSIPQELGQIEQALKKHDFVVEQALDPDSRGLEDAFRNFINRYGYDQENRLLFFYSGHGYSRTAQGSLKGYLVPSDAPLPGKDEKGFLRMATTMSDIVNWAKKMEAKHALYLFDSCFSGTIFKTRSAGEKPAIVSVYTSRPVRQFITAGSANEPVPAKSVFAPAFIRAIRGEADLTGDGYVTGTELGLYLSEKVASYQTGQTPQYGKIRDPNLDEGDFVFRIKGKAVGSRPASISETSGSVLRAPGEPIAHPPLQSASGLRSTPTTLGMDEVKRIALKKGFYLRDWNPAGTGLSHEYISREANGGEFIIDNITGLCWSQRSEEVDVEGARKRIAEFNREAYGGFSDWRLPTLEEAMSLLEASEQDNGSYLNPVLKRRAGIFWTADSLNTVKNWVVDVNEASVYPEPVKMEYHVRAVRNI